MDNITRKISKHFNKKLRKKCPSLKYHSCVVKNFPVNLEIQKMLELRLLKAYQIIHRSIQSPCGLNQAVRLQLNLRTFFDSPIVGFTALHCQLGRAFILLLWEPSGRQEITAPLKSCQVFLRQRMILVTCSWQNLNC